MNLLGSAKYDPAAAVSKATSSLLAMTAVDTTNLRLAITVPAHGKVMFRLKCAINGATTMPAILLGAMNGATVLGRQVPQMNTDTQSLATQNAYAWAEFIATGLTPGAMNVDAAYAVQVVVAATNIKYGGPDSNAGANAWGAFVFEAWDPQTDPVAIAPGAAGGLQICGANAASTYATLTVTGAFNVNGVNAVSQTGDNFARIGAPVGASISADIAAVKTDTAAIKVQTDKITFTVANQIDSNVLDWKSAVAPAMTGDAFARLGAPAGASISADIAAVKAAELTAAQIATGVWQDTVAGDFTAALSIGKSVMNGVALGTGLTINAYTGNTAQTGDSFARLGAPVGASHSADVAAVKTDTAAVKVQTDKLTFTVANQIDSNVLDWKSSVAPAMTGDAFARLGAPVGASISADIAAVKAAELTAAQIATGVWTDTVAGDFTTALSVGKSVMNGVSLGTGLTVASLTNAPTAGDFTATMKTSLNAATPAVTVSDKTGFSLSAAGVQAIWDALTSALTTVGSIGKLLVDNINATISSRLPTSGYTAPDNADIVLIKAKTDGLPPDPADASDVAAAFGIVNSAISGLNNISPAGVRTAVGLASANLDTQLAAIPTKVAIADEVATRTLSANVKKINDVTLQGNGSTTKWGP